MAKYDKNRRISFSRDAPVYSNDLNCIVFWDNYDEPYGIGDSSDAAFTDLMTKMASL